MLADPDSSGHRLLLVDRPGAAQSELRIGHVAVSRRTPDYHALLLLNLVLGGQFVSRLNMNLREHKGYTYGARSWFEFRLGRGPFQMSASVQTDVTADAIREALGEVSAMRGDRPVTVDELETARAALTRGYPRNFETADQVARSVAQLALYELPDDYFATFVPRVEALGLDADPRRRCPPSPSRSPGHAGRRGQGASRRDAGRSLAWSPGAHCRGLAGRRRAEL